MGNVLVVSNSQNYLIFALKNMCEKEDINMIVEPYKMPTFLEPKADLRCILLYVDEHVTDATPCLHAARNLSIGKSIPLYVVLDIPKEDVEEFHKIMPVQYFKTIFNRPINAIDVAKQITDSNNDSGIMSKKKILVVDDSGTVLRNMRSLLEKDYEVFMANSSVMAIKCIALNKPDLVLLDYEMPICNGAMMYQMLKAEKEYTDIPVIFLTGKNDKESVMKVMELKPQGYLLKSMEPSKIINSIFEFFHEHPNMGEE